MFKFPLVGLPIAVGVTVMRYRLYEIDLIVNRTLVYGTPSAMLVALYFGGTVVMQRLFVILTGQKSTLAVVGIHSRDSCAVQPAASSHTGLHS